jgi:hypothetical protein
MASPHLPYPYLVTKLTPNALHAPEPAVLAAYIRYPLVTAYCACPASWTDPKADCGWRDGGSQPTSCRRQTQCVPSLRGPDHCCGGRRLEGCQARWKKYFSTEPSIWGQVGSRQHRANNLHNTVSASRTAPICLVFSHAADCPQPTRCCP